MNHYVCDWCEEWDLENCCYCEYGYDRDGRYLEWECESCYREKSKPVDLWTAEKSKPVDPWTAERSTISGHLSMFSLCSTPAERVEVLRPLFEYLLTIGSFFKAFPRFHAICVAKVAEFKADQHAAPILELLTSVEDFLRDVAV